MILSLSWGFPVTASAPNTESIPDWKDNYVFATTYYDIPKFNLKPTGNGACVDFIKVNGYKEYRGNARDWVKYINTDKPSIGGVVILNESKYGHLGLIIGIKDGIQIAEQNYKELYQINYRTIPTDYLRIIGFIKL